MLLFKSCLASLYYLHKMKKQKKTKMQHGMKTVESNNNKAAIFSSLKATNEK